MDIYDMLFYSLLRFDPADPFLTGEFTHDIVYGILLPVIGLYIILNVFSSTFAGGHTKVKNLITIGALAVIIVNGWYPVIAHLFVPIFIIALVLGTFKTFKRMIMSKETEAGLLKLGAKGMGKLGEWFYKKYKRYDKTFLFQLVGETVRLEYEREVLRKAIERIESKHELKGEGWAYVIQELHKRLADVEYKLRENENTRIKLGITNEDWEKIKKEYMKRYGKKIKEIVEKDTEATIESGGIKDKEAEKITRNAEKDVNRDPSIV